MLATEKNTQCREHCTLHKICKGREAAPFQKSCALFHGANHRASARQRLRPAETPGTQRRAAHPAPGTGTLGVQQGNVCACERWGGWGHVKGFFAAQALVRLGNASFQCHRPRAEHPAGGGRRQPQSPEPGASPQHKAPLSSPCRQVVLFYR